MNKICYTFTFMCLYRCSSYDM